MEYPYTDYKFLKQYQLLQSDIMFDNIFDLGFAIIGYSETDKSTFWNLALLGQSINKDQIDSVEAKFFSLDRKPTFYIPNIPELKSFVSRLEDVGYKKEYEDCFQVWQNGYIDKSYFSSVKKVLSSSDLEIFLDVFNASYQKDDPKNPYGELGDYLKVARRVWQKHHETNRLEYFIAYKNNTPVAVSTLTNHKGFGYISNVGSILSVRGEGFGKAATLYCVDQSIKNSNSIHYLATEEGHYPNDFYKRIGFEAKFSAVGYTKNY